VSNSQAVEWIHRLFAENCDGDRDALLAATAIGIAQENQVGPATVAARRLTEMANHARQRPAAVWVAECRALSLAHHVSYWVFLHQMYASNPAIEGEMEEYLRRFGLGLLDQLEAQRDGRFTPSDAAEDVIAWGRALGVFANVWIEGENRGQSEAERMKSLWMA
jgi:hypothetical protein